MRKIRANAIAILTVAWILGTFYYLWQDNRAHAASSGGRGAKRAGGRPEQLREDRTIPLIVTGTPSKGFDEKAYLSAKLLKPGEDPYRQHAFNQLESDKLSPDRPIRDTRHYRGCQFSVADSAIEGQGKPPAEARGPVAPPPASQGQ